jgi:aminopeptidase N
MFGKVAAFELRYQLKAPVFWISAIIVFLLTFGSVTSDVLQIGATSNVHVNSPAALIQVCLIFSLFFMFFSTALVANVVVRDDDTGFGPIIRATPITKFDYLYGRFLGAWLAVALAFLAVPLAVVIGSAMPWLDPEKVGPLRPLDYLYAYAVVALPSLFFISAVFFALAAATRSIMASYVGVVAFLVLYIITNALAVKPEFQTLRAYLEPFGIGAFGSATRYWTASERNTLLPPLLGPMLWNRLLWTGIGVALLASAYGLFRFEPVAKKARSRDAERDALQAGSPVGSTALSRPVRPTDTRRFGASVLLAQFIARTRFDMAQVFKSPAFFVLLALGVFNAGASLWFTVTDSLYGDNIYPVTREMIMVARGAFGFIPIIVSIYYAGELVWRERDRKTDELIDVTPAPDWVFVAPKIAAISLVLFSMLAVSIFTGVLVQLLRGYVHFELGKYIGWYVLPEGVDFILLAVLAVFFQTLAPHKFVGWGLAVLFIICQIVMTKLGWEHNLYQYGSGPDVPLSDMNGPGLAGVARDWFRAYWSAVALGLVVLIYGLWRRGPSGALWPRLKRLPHRLAGPAGGILVFSLVAAAGLGGFIFLNTNVWNAYRTQLGDERYLADYEKALLPFEKVPQPKVVDVKLNIDLYPDRPEAITRGVYTFQNKTSAPIKDLHIRFDRDLVVRSLSVDGARPLKTYDRFNYRIFAFDAPMAPGEIRKLSFTTWRGQHGFKNSDNTSTRIYQNGSFVTNDLLTPALGMDRNGLLEDRAKRRKYGLPPELRMPKLEDAAARQFNVLRKDADWVTSDITVSTLADQTPIAPGYRVADRIANGRHTSEFRTEAPINMFFSVQSARYAVRRQTYKGVDLAIYYDPHHPWNVDRMIAALKVGLDYDQANFSPYQFRQVRILEFPDYAQFAQSFANTIPYSEGIGFIIDARDKAKIDMVTYVTAHELGHQWWAHQVIGANMQGGAMLAETFAQYSALMAMKHLYGPDQIRKFLKYELDSYLRSRGGEASEELPLERVEIQPYIYYRKGSLVMYRLQDELGEAPVNRALQNLIARYAFKGAPYPTTKDFLADLRAEAPADKQQLITDLFEKITLYDLKAVKATSKRRPDGRYDVTLEVSGAKLYADGKGKETPAPLNEAFDIGLFAKEPGRSQFTAKDVILFEHVPIHSGPQTFHFTVARAPAFAGVDPYNKAIDRNSEDNIAHVGG